MLFYFFSTMELTKDEKALFKYLAEQELKKVEGQEEDIRPNIPFLAAEEKYEILLENILKKLR